MGQRLNISIEKDGKVLANAYYHWSAYTMPSLELLKEVFNALNSVENIENDKLKAIALLEITGAHLTPTEIDYLNELNLLTKEEIETLNVAQSRNDGLIAISKNGIEETEAWAEHTITIDLGKKIIIFDVFFFYEEKDCGEDNICNIDMDFPNIKFEDFEMFTNKIKGLNPALYSNKQSYLKFRNNPNIFGFIY